MAPFLPHFRPVSAGLALHNRCVLPEIAKPPKIRDAGLHRQLSVRPVTALSAFGAAPTGFLIHFQYLARGAGPAESRRLTPSARDHLFAQLRVQ